MTEPMPKWMSSENVYTIKDDGHDRPDCFLLAVKDSASDREKRRFEEEMNRLFKPISAILYPELMNPRYLWNGEVTEYDPVEAFRKRREVRSADQNK